MMLNKNRSHSSSLRKGRWSSAGQIYHITVCTEDRDPIFFEFCHARALIRIMREEASRGTTSTLAFVVMPDHFHWLMQLEQQDLSVVVGRVKSMAARKVGKPIWQPGYHDHALRQEEDLQVVARYIVANPIRAGLVDDIGLYPHWDAVWL